MSVSLFRFLFAYCRFKAALCLYVCLVLVYGQSATAGGEEVYQDRAAFVQQAFADLNGAAEQKRLWLSKDLKQDLLKRIDYHAPGLRIRYWQSGDRTAWILDEIGKERPITIGVVIENMQVKDVQVLVYRESRGGEVRYDFFTQQFKGVELKQAKNRYTLNASVDGITGATLSVRAVKKVATLALFLHQAVTTHPHDPQKETPQ